MHRDRGSTETAGSASQHSRIPIVKAYFGDVVKSTVIVAGGDVHYTTIVQGQEITLPTLGELAAYRNAVANCYARWDDPRYIQEEGEFLPLFASPYDVVEGPGRERADLLDAIRSARRIIVLGEPGMGKTTALERLMLEYARQDDGSLPVFVPLLYYTGDLMESIRTELNRHAAFYLADEAHTRAFLQGVPCVLMFDGLNEVSGRLREKIAGEIRHVMGDYPRQRYAVTSRSQDELWQSLRGEDEDLPAVVIREISDEQVRDYLCGHLGAKAGQALYDKLDERMRGLAHNPLLLWMIKEARTDETGALPDNRGRLFDHFVTQMLKREVRLKEWATSVPAEVKRECLSELAYEMFTSERESRLFVTSGQADVVLSAYLEKRPGTRYEARQVLEESKRNGLLTGEENVRFMHQSVQEFFAALVLRNKVRIDATRTGPGRFGQRIRNAVISRLTAAAASLSRPPEWSISSTLQDLSCLSFLVLGIIVLCLMPSIWCLAGTERLRVLLWPAAIALLVGLFPWFLVFARRLFAWFQYLAILNFRRPVARWLLTFFETCWFMHVADDWWAETFILLAGMADDPSWLVRQLARENAWLAHWCLLEGQEVDEEARLAVEQATTEALTSPQPDVRLRAVQALSGMANPRTVEPLIAVLGDEDEGVARVAQRALVRMGEGAVGPLEGVSKDHKAPLLTRIRTGNTLVRISERRADASSLIAVISDQGAPLAERLRAGNELGRVDDPRFHGLCLEPELITVSGGEFWMGWVWRPDEKLVRGEGEIDGRPGHPVHVPEFHMAKYPVTNAQFKCFVDAGGYHQAKYWTKAGWVWRQGEGKQYGREHHEWPEGWEDGHFPPERANHPVVEVTWHEALAYTHWLAEATGKPYRLPTEAEWEKAARGGVQISNPQSPVPNELVDNPNRVRRYPWGDEFDAKKVNMRIGDETVGGTSPVGIYPGGASPYGILDLSGNVWEWCSSLSQEYPYDSDDGREDLEVEGSRVLRGGSWVSDDRGDARCSYRDVALPPSNFNVRLGFRILVSARSLPVF